MIDDNCPTTYSSQVCCISLYCVCQSVSNSGQILIKLKTKLLEEELELWFYLIECFDFT